MPSLLSLPSLSLRSLCVPVFEAFLAQAERLPDRAGGMGEMEESLSSDLVEMQRLALERGAQAKADGADNTRCPVCAGKLERITGGHERTVQSRFGAIVLRRSKGWCPKCEEWRFPADDLLGLHKRAPASPTLQEASSLLVSKMPAEEAAKVLARLTGRPADDSTMAREARRAGERAKTIRKKMDEEACHTEGRWRVTEQVRAALGPAPFVLVIEMDAWLVRERDEWGNTGQLREAGTKFSRWHWVYTATIFRLDARGKTQSGRPMILSRAHVATREGLDGFSQQVYAEAVRQGMLIAEDTLVIADGGVWIWKIADDRFPHARKRLDMYHAVQHLGVIAAELHGAGTKEAAEWTARLAHQLRHGGEAGVVETVADLARAADPSQKEVLEREAGYFKTHKDRMDYEKGASNGEPIGSGAIESTCRQHQCRFKRPGMFWTTGGDDALLALECFWRNERWNLLFPHSARPVPARN